MEGRSIWEICQPQREAASMLAWQVLCPALSCQQKRLGCSSSGSSSSAATHTSACTFAAPDGACWCGGD